MKIQPFTVADFPDLPTVITLLYSTPAEITTGVTPAPEPEPAPAPAQAPAPAPTPALQDVYRSTWSYGRREQTPAEVPTGGKNGG